MYTLLLRSACAGLLATVALGILKSADEKQYTPLEKGFYLSAQDAAWLRPGLNLQILNVTISADRKPAVTFKISDSGGQALDRSGVITPGVVSANFILAYIPANDDQYLNYVTRTTYPAACIGLARFLHAPMVLDADATGCGSVPCLP